MCWAVEIDSPMKTLMCVMAILYKKARKTPILIASNREEQMDRPTQAPKIQSGTPRVVCGIDRKAGGTWFGINQHGLVTAVTNRKKRQVPADPRSRGLLCRELLNFRTAREAAQFAASELATGAYAGANYVCVDEEYGAVVHGGDKIETVELTPGLHVLTNGDVNDRKDERHDMVRRMLTLHTLDSSVTFLAAASRAFARTADTFGRQGIVVMGDDFGTVSSTLLSLPSPTQQAVFQYAPGPPSEKTYDDLSALLRQVLSTDKSKKKKIEEEELDGELLGDPSTI